MAKSRLIAEFGDFQTPDALAKQVVDLVRSISPHAATVVEPSCGRGAFLVAAASSFPDAALFGLDINENHLAVAAERLGSGRPVALRHASFFFYDWNRAISELAAPLLILGNPPWVTNAELGGFKSGNVPPKENFKGLSGYDALTGKSNFDISEWMLLQNIEWLRAKGGALAVLCKSAVARKVIAAAFRSSVPVSDARCFKIDALEHFGAAVDAVLLYLCIDGRPAVHQCAIYDNLCLKEPSRHIGFSDGVLISDTAKFERQRDLSGKNHGYKWRSGIKHDCSKVMELEITTAGLKNGFGETVSPEEEYLFPLLKSSDVAKGVDQPRKLVLVTQRAIGDDTKGIRMSAPRTWEYLWANRAALDARTSTIYRNKPPFSIFGVGPYSFAPWKVAISGLYKKLAFLVVGPHNGKPVMMDDTVYFLGFETREQAERAHAILQSDTVSDFYESMVFWDEKRPITVDLLKRLDIDRAGLKIGVAPLISNAEPDQRRLFA